MVPAAGAGLRLGGGTPKALRLLGGDSLIGHAVRRLSQASVIQLIVVCAPVGTAGQLRSSLQPAVAGTGVQLLVVDGGEQRHDSVAAALAATPGSYDVVLVHDAARCLTPTWLVEAVADRVTGGDAVVVPGLAVADTVKMVDGDGLVTATLPRAQLRQVQTPQGFRRQALADGHAWLAARTAAGQPPAVTDDAMLAESCGHPVRVIDGSPLALKLTHPHDFAVALALLEQS